MGIRIGIGNIRIGYANAFSWAAYWAEKLDTWHKDLSCTSEELIILLGDKTSTPDVAESTGINLVIKSFNPIYLIGIGDYEDATRAVSDLNINLTTLAGIYASAGNHDMDKNGNRVDFNAFWGHGISEPGAYQKVSTTYIDFFIHDQYLKEDESGYYTYLQSEARSVDSFKNCTQGQWLIAQMAASTKPWKILVTHQPPWGSNNPASTNLMTGMRWDWYDYGIDLILCGHGHFYERMLIDTGSANIPLIQLGPGGSNHINWGAVADGSIVRINENTDADFNAGMLHLLRAGANRLVFDLWAINSSFVIDAVIKDSLIITK